MAFNADNYAKTEVTQPSEKIAPGDQFGRIRVAYDEITMTAEITAGGSADDILGPLLPKGARVHFAVLQCSGDLGGTADLTLGHLASDDGSISEDANAFVDTVDCTGQAGYGNMLDGNGAVAKSANAGSLLEFSEAVRVIVRAAGASASATGVKISMAVYYSLD